MKMCAFSPPFHFKNKSQTTPTPCPPHVNHISWFFTRKIEDFSKSVCSSLECNRTRWIIQGVADSSRIGCRQQQGHNTSPVQQSTYAYTLWYVKSVVLLQFTLTHNERRNVLTFSEHFTESKCNYPGSSHPHLFQTETKSFYM